MQTMNEFKSIKFQRPTVTQIQASANSVRFIVGGEVIRISASTAAQNTKIDVHCFLCGAEWTGHWREDGSPEYTGGLLTARFRQKGTNRLVRREQACHCEAGKRFVEVQPASNRTMRSWKRLLNWKTIRTASFIVDGAE